MVMSKRAPRAQVKQWGCYTVGMRGSPIAHKGLPSRYEGRYDGHYVLKGRSRAETEELAARILGGIAEGKSLRALLREPGTCSMRTFFMWLRADRDLHALYVRAREAQAEGYADEIADIADQAAGLDAAGVNAARLRVDARKWIAAKLLPRKYGDHVNIEHSGALSVVAASRALREVRPPVFDEDGNEVEDAVLVHDAGAGRDASGTMLAGVSANGGGEGPLARGSEGYPRGYAPGKGTPTSTGTHVSAQSQNPKIPAENLQSLSESRQPAMSDLL